MRASVAVLLGLLVIGSAQSANDTVGQAIDLEKKGQSAEARLLLRRAAGGAGASVETLTAYAEFLDRYHDPEAVQAYEKVLAALGSAGSSEKRASISRRLVILSLIRGDQTAAARYLDRYRAAGGGDWGSAPKPGNQPLPTEDRPTIEIPGPFFSFARMAALSQEISLDDLLPALARNVVTNGYQASSGNEALDQTEYLKLLIRYLSQARELQRLAGDGQAIRIEACESTQTGELLRILGYRMRGGCGSEVILETVNASRAFLTIDSGFPLAELEQDLRTNRPFVYEFKPTKAPILYGAEYWLGSKDRKDSEFIDVFLADPALCRLYLGLSKLDTSTAEQLRRAVAMQRLRAFAHVLDFFGAMFEIREGKALVPGGARSERAWEDLAGVSPARGAEFFERLISKDDGWMASYFDSLMRIRGPVQDYLTEPERIKRFYMAIRGKVTSPGPARPVFRSNTDMVLLTTRLWLEADGKPHVPGGLEVWRGLFTNNPKAKYDKNLSRLAVGWKEPDDVLEALFGLCRKAVDNEPLKIFMALSDVDRMRTKPLEPATVDRLAREYREIGAQYKILSEVPGLTDKTILEFVDTIDKIDAIRDTARRADSAGTMQALVGLWQIFCRQGSIAASDADAALSEVLAKFDRFRNSTELFNAGRAGIEVLLKAARSGADVSPQERLLELLAGTSRPVQGDAHDRVVQEMTRIFEAQRLVSVSTLFELADHLEAVARGERVNTVLVNRMAALIGEIELPRASLTTVERNSLAFGYWTERHIQEERKLNLRAEIDKAAGTAEKLQDIRGDLAPFLRDTLVGFNYIHYAPPGAQVLHTNPVFVRSHDFIGLQGTRQMWRTTDLFGTGWPSSAGGRLVGSLAGLPYALAETEQNFLVPSREQALIWGDLVPQMILSAKIPRWWNVSASQMHWVGLHLRYAEVVLAEAALDPGSRARALEVLERQFTPARKEKVARSLEAGDVPGALRLITPAESFFLAKEVLAQQGSVTGIVATQIRGLAGESPETINYQAISRAFGTPKPTLTTSYQPQLLYLRPFPTLMGYSSRIMAESWESNVLYWAALADQAHLPPSDLNVLVPEWTQRTVERIFATHLEDWPALLRSLRLIGDDIRAGTRVQIAAQQKASAE